MAESTTTIETDPTVSSRLFHTARPTIPFCAARTSCTFSSRRHSLGSENSRRAASVWSLAAVRTMKAKGMTNTIAASPSARTSSQ